MTKEVDRVFMTKQEFDSLLNYSCSIPTGIVIGKIWKRGVPYQNPVAWYLGEYVESTNKNICVVWREIVIGIPVDYLDYTI